MGGDRRRAHLIGAIYGMNFEHMPELGQVGVPGDARVWRLISAFLFRRLRRAGWL